MSSESIDSELQESLLAEAGLVEVQFLDPDAIAVFDELCLAEFEKVQLP